MEAPNNTKAVWKYSLQRQKVLEIKESQIVETPEAVAKFASRIGLHQQEQEHLIAVVLDTKNQIKGYYTVSIGLIDKSCAHAREVFRFSILLAASKVILLHNHPTGDTTPSRQDIATTKQLVQAGEVIGIQVIDHIIVGEDKSYFSFQQGGLMK